MNPGDRVMLVNGGYGHHRLHIKEDKVKAIYKNGLIVLERSHQKFRANGLAIGAHGYGPRPRLQAWDDALWQEYQRQQDNAEMSLKLHRLIDIINRVHDDEKRAEIWQALPYVVRKLVGDSQ